MKSTNKVSYDAFCILCDWRYTTFDDKYQTKEAYKFITENGVSVTPNGEIERNQKTSPLEHNASCMPIRIMIDESGEDFADDWTFDSPISEINWNGILRWWPKAWMYLDGNIQIPETITIHYGKIDINLKPIQANRDVMKKSFADVIIGLDKTMVDAYDQSIDDVKTILMENNMFNKKKQQQKEIVVKEEPKEEVLKPESKPEEKNMAKETETTVTTSTTEGKKKVVTAKKVIIGATAVAALTGIGFAIYKIVSLKKSGKPSAKATA